MKTNRTNRLLACLTALLLTAALLSGTVALASSQEPTIITTRDGFLKAVAAADEGDTLYVGSIDFTIEGTGAVHDAEVIAIEKGLTVKAAGEGPALFTGASFFLNGAKVANKRTSWLFENIIFDGEILQEEIEKSDWELSYLSGTDELISPNPLKCKYAVAFSGNTDAAFIGCTFRNYMYDQGGAVRAFYGNYDFNGYNNSLCFLNAYFDKCSFTGNSAKYGGAVFIDALQNNASFRFDNCVFKGNAAGVSMDNWGGGAMHVAGGKVDAYGCLFEGNTANYKFIGDTVTRDERGGGAIFLYNGELAATACRFVSNQASCGGAIGMMGTSKLTANGCSFRENKAIAELEEFESDLGRMSGNSIGGALFVQSYCSVRLYHTSIFGNVAQNVSGGVHLAVADPASSAVDFEMVFCSVADNICNTTPAEYRSDDLWRPYVYPYDIYALNGFSAQACFVSEELFGSLFEKYQMPEEGNGYNYYASPERAKNDGVMQKTTGEDAHIYPIGPGFDVPTEFASEILGDAYTHCLGTFRVGSNYTDAELLLSSGGGTSDSLPYLWGKELTLPEASKKRHTFLGWYLEDGTMLGDGDVLFITPTAAPVTLYPRFEKIPLDIPWGWIAGGAGLALLTASSLLLLAYHRKKAVLNVQTEAAPLCTAENTATVDTSMLSEREKTVLDLLLRGKKRKDIAAELYISEETVKKQITSLYGKLGVASRHELFALFK